MRLASANGSRSPFQRDIRSRLAAGCATVEPRSPHAKLWQLFAPLLPAGCAGLLTTARPIWAVVTATSFAKQPSSRAEADTCAPSHLVSPAPTPP